MKEAPWLRPYLGALAGALLLLEQLLLIRLVGRRDHLRRVRRVELLQRVAQLREQQVEAILVRGLDVLEVDVDPVVAVALDLGHALGDEARPEARGAQDRGRRVTIRDIVDGRDKLATGSLDRLDEGLVAPLIRPGK